ncbi:ATP-binding cassette domain-containing protein [Pseudarthrobacter sp. J75]|uniref:methionine ABC transporter ATP-binding protein n=1 Tax=unclassified Pseudarthrobacter TaxID=2647000 RepID=UPI002E823401|nr:MULTISPECIES: ATP-binding cassette domain-containing protein [unclassified Pseudarthrobacter]MEE2521857.1 ATP-binding cassette domain-containing protein [Pseudarthrobacter sp. J47]MEE2527934.1 ATP-binding cassette domain-containing protein [Pseudarthrobacter sp. J75]MEE2569505.1 ATP-binding cassette domain-containing protein [Pseudarthrobacter sp. J64]
MISVDRVTKSYGSGTARVEALADVSLTVRSGEIFGVVGQSGAGKSTLIRTINSLERPDSGTVTVDGRNMSTLAGAELRAARHNIGMIFQHFNLLSSRTVQANVELSLEITGVARSARRARALEILELVGLHGKADAYPAQLSGGQKQRVGIARALASSPSVLLSDEATSALDPETTRQILDLIRQLSRDLGLTVLLITHEMDVVKRICDSAAVMSQGRILEQGPVEQLLTTEKSLLGHALFPLGEVPDTANRVVEITFTGVTSDKPVIARLAREHGIDVGILGAALETIHGHQTGRTRLELPGEEQTVAAAIADLRAQGLFVEVIK